MKKAALTGIIVVLAVVGFLFFFGQNSGHRVRIVREGDQAPEFRLQSLDGQTVSLSAYRGKVTLVHFWATWCPPCVDEIPTLDRMYRSLSDKNLVILAVSVDEGGGRAVGGFMQKNGLHLPVLLDPDQSVARSYGTFKFPETYVVDREGIVRYKAIGARDWMHPANIQSLKAMLDKR